MIERLLDILYQERGETRPPGMSDAEKERYFRALCNVRPPEPVSDEFLELQDAYLQEKTRQRDVVDVSAFDYRDGIALWQGDITRLNCDAIVNACNSALLGCFQPLHACIDNVIHSWAGVQVRLDCHEIMQGTHLPNGDVKVTSAYNLPSFHIFHTVGPIVKSGKPTEQDMKDLKQCYVTCLEKAREMQIETIAFCCISTGVYGYPQKDASQLAIKTVRAWLREHGGLRVIFNVFLDEDRQYYEDELSQETGES